MDPASILAIVNGSIGLTMKIATVTKDLYDLAKSYRDAELAILSIAEECEIIRLAWRKIENWCQSWAKTNFADMELLERLDRSLVVGMMIMSALKKDVEPLGEFTESSGFIRRAKVLWNDDSFQTHQNRIRGQVVAMSLLLEAIRLPSIEDRHELLVREEHVLRSSDESVYALFDAESGAFRHNTDNLSTAESTELVYRGLDFEDDLFTSRVYKRNYGYSAQSAQIVESMQKDHTNRRIEDPPRRPGKIQVGTDGSLDDASFSDSASTHRIQSSYDPSSLLRFYQDSQRISINNLGNLGDTEHLEWALPSELPKDKYKDLDNHQAASDTTDIGNINDLNSLKYRYYEALVPYVREIIGLVRGFNSTSGMNDKLEFRLGSLYHAQLLRELMKLVKKRENRPR